MPQRTNGPVPGRAPQNQQPDQQQEFEEPGSVQDNSLPHPVEANFQPSNSGLHISTEQYTREGPQRANTPEPAAPEANPDEGRLRPTESDAEKTARKESMGFGDPNRTRPIYYGNDRPSAPFDPNNFDIEPWMDRDYIEQQLKYMDENGQFD